MRRLRASGTLLASALLASALHAAPNGNPPVRATRPPPKESCQPSCLIMRVSTRCQCSLGKTLPAVAAT